MIIFVYILFIILAMLVISLCFPGFTNDLNTTYFLSITAIFALSALVILLRKHFPFFKTLSVYIAIFLTIFIIAEGALIYYSGDDIPTGNEQAIIVPGGGLFVESRLTDELEKRLDKAIEIYSKNPTLPIVLSGGSGVDRTLPQAVAMKSYLDKKIVQQELPSPYVIIEDVSTGLHNNITASFDKLTEYVPPQVTVDYLPAYIIVSRHNVPTAKIIGNKLSPDSTIIGAEYPLSKYVIYYIREIWFTGKAFLMTIF